MGIAAKRMISHIPITKARINLGAVVKRVHLKGEYFILEKDGIPIAAIMDADEFEDYLELRDPGIRKKIDASRKDFEAGRVRHVSDFIAELNKDKKISKTRRPVKRS